MMNHHAENAVAPRQATRLLWVDVSPDRIADELVHRREHGDVIVRQVRRTGMNGKPIIRLYYQTGEPMIEYR